MMTEEEFRKIEWPEIFLVRFDDGVEQEFVSSEGVSWDGGADNEGTDENRASIAACWRKKSPTKNHFTRVEFFVDQVVFIKSQKDGLLWGKNA